MTEPFKIAEITPTGVSIKVGSHRTALGVNDFDTLEEYETAMTALLEKHCGKGMSSLLAAVASAKVDSETALEEQKASLRAEHKLALEAAVKAVELDHSKAVADLKATHAAAVSGMASEYNNEIQGLKAAHDKAVQDLKDSYTKVELSLTADCSKLVAKLNETQSLLEALGTTEQAIALKEKLEAERLRKVMADAAVELQKLEAKKKPEPAKESEDEPIIIEGVEDA